MTVYEISVGMPSWPCWLTIRLMSFQRLHIELFCVCHISNFFLDWPLCKRGCKSPEEAKSFKCLNESRLEVNQSQWQKLWEGCVIEEQLVAAWEKTPNYSHSTCGSSSPWLLWLFIDYPSLSGSVIISCVFAHSRIIDSATLFHFYVTLR